jgi:hypothetical protein
MGLEKSRALSPRRFSAKLGVFEKRNVNQLNFYKQLCVASATGCIENREFSLARFTRTGEHAPHRARLGASRVRALRGASMQGALGSRPFF